MFQIKRCWFSSQFTVNHLGRFFYYSRIFNSWELMEVPCTHAAVSTLLLNWFFSPTIFESFKIILHHYGEKGEFVNLPRSFTDSKPYPRQDLLLPGFVMKAPPGGEIPFENKSSRKAHRGVSIHLFQSNIPNQLTWTDNSFYFLSFLEHFI